MNTVERQSRLDSALETAINILIGFFINFFANLLILPHFGFNNLTLGKNVLIGIAFTVVSVARQYVIRRWAQDHLIRLRRLLAAAIQQRLTLWQLWTQLKVEELEAFKQRLELQIKQEMER